ncbi:MAG: CRISPR-associated endonuclease Cas1 [Clostridiales bacterium]
MKLILNTPGLFLCKRGECFQVKDNENKNDISSKKVEQIIITTHVMITTDAIELAIDNNIDIVFLKENGYPMGRVWHSKHGSISTIRRKQLFLEENSLGINLVKEWISEKMQNQINLLNKLAVNRRDERKDFIYDTVNKIKGVKSKLDCIDNTSINQVRNTIQGFEGSASRFYFETINEIFPEKYKFKGRSRNPALDYFNCFLNYSYGILYSSVEKSCILAGLDPYIGIMHTDNYNKKALIFDVVEKYRGYMDNIVCRLFTKKRILDNFFDKVENGYYLNKNGKKLLIDEYNKELENKIKRDGRNIEFRNIIQYDCHKIANRILEED